MPPAAGSNDLGAILTPPPVIHSIARAASVDDRIEFIGDTIQETTRHVVLHQSRQNLRPQINAALQWIEVDGRLSELRQRYNLVLLDPPPEVLTVGIADLPPLSIVDVDWDHSGFNVEVMNALAARTELEIRYVVLPVAEWVKGPVVNGLDIIVALVKTPARGEFMDLSLPIIERPLAVSVEADQPDTIATLSDLAGLRVGVIAGSIFQARAAEAGLDFQLFPNNEAIVDAKAVGEIDVGIVPVQVAREALARTETGESFKIVELSNERIDTSIALRPGLGAIRTRLNAAISLYVLTSDYAALRQAYFGQPVYWTEARLRFWAWVSAVLIVAAALISILTEPARKGA